MKLVEDSFKFDQNPKRMQRECAAMIAMLDYVCDQIECLNIEKCVEPIKMAREQLVVVLTAANRPN